MVVWILDLKGEVEEIELDFKVIEGKEECRGIFF